MDIYGEVIDSMYLGQVRPRSVAGSWGRAVELVDWVCANWGQPDDGMWEVRADRQRFTMSAVMRGWRSSAVRMAAERGLPTSMIRRQTRNDNHTVILQDTAGPMMSSRLTQALAGDRVDASLLVMPLVEIRRPDRPTVAVDARPHRAGALTDGLVDRYDHRASTTGSMETKGPSASARSGSSRPWPGPDAGPRPDLFEKMLTYAKPMGLYCEQIGPSGCQMGNYPQAFTHLSLISAAMHLVEALDTNRKADVNDLDSPENTGLPDEEGGDGLRSDALRGLRTQRRSRREEAASRCTGRVGGRRGAGCACSSGWAGRDVAGSELLDGLRSGGDRRASTTPRTCNSTTSTCAMSPVTSTTCQPPRRSPMSSPAATDRPSMPRRLRSGWGPRHGVHRHLPESTRLVVEKPFADSAHGRIVGLHDEIVGEIGEGRLFIVDHFLAKSAVENLLTVRISSNRLFDTMLRAEHADSIEVEMLETGDADGRGSFNESAGAIADVVQNHPLQILVKLTMEAPADRTVGAYHAARSTSSATSHPSTTPRWCSGNIRSHCLHESAADDSSIETYVDLVTSIDTDRWRVCRSGSAPARQSRSTPRASHGVSA